MAKLTARGARELGPRYRHPETGTIYTLRSDGTVLSKTSVEGDGWKVFLRLRPVTYGPDIRGLFEKVAQNRGWARV